MVDGPGIQSELTLEQAIGMLTIGEKRAIEKELGREVFRSEEYAQEMVYGLVWAFERRRTQMQFTWKDLDDMTIETVMGYFEIPDAPAEQAQDTEVQEDPFADDAVSATPAVAPPAAPTARGSRASSSRATGQRAGRSRST